MEEIRSKAKVFEDRPPRVLHLSTYDALNGAARGSVWLNEGLRHRGIESSMIVARCPFARAPRRGSAISRAATAQIERRFACSLAMQSSGRIVMTVEPGEDDRLYGDKFCKVVIKANPSSAEHLRTCLSGPRSSARQSSCRARAGTFLDCLDCRLGLQPRRLQRALPPSRKASTGSRERKHGPRHEDRKQSFDIVGEFGEWCPGAESNHRHCDFQMQYFFNENKDLDRYSSV